MRTSLSRGKNAGPFMRRYRMILILLLICNIIGIIWFTYYKFNSTIPNKIRILVDKTQKFDFKLPIEADIITEDVGVLQVNESNVPSNQIHINFNEPFSLQSSQTGSYTVILKLFGFLELKKISLDVIESMELIPSGMPIGITLRTNGILVLGTAPITGADGMNYEPAINILKTGDYIIAVNGKTVSSKEELIKLIQKTNGDKIDFKVRRKKTEINVSVKPVKTADGEYKIGTWIRDDTQGIGTLTFISSSGDFGALGHGITDVDTGVLMDIGQGAIYHADIISIVKGQSGAPGELSGVIHQNEAGKIGTLLKNTNQGIFGVVNNNSDIYKTASKNNYNKALQIGLKQEVQIGDASILCYVEGKIKEYSILIEEVDLNSNNLSKGLVIKITDPDLIATTGGIVQGMSGSPIIQNGKLIGAVTHVFVRDPERGYGTFIENMIQVLQE